VSYLAAHALARAIAGGSLSSREVTRELLDRITSVGAPLNALIELDAERALAAAASVDAQVAVGGPLGPLAGVPVTVKEAFAVAGLPTTAGLPELAGRRAAVDAPAVAALRNAGAVILGTTNVPTLLADLQCDNPVYGRTANPWDAGRSPGGSSGGSAEALAAGLSPLELGSDLGGSIRVPAAWCGVYGLRPSNGLISKRGHLPWPLDGLLEPAMSVAGPMARNVADLELAFQVLTGRTPGPALPPRFHRGLRIAVWTEASGAPADKETRACLARARKALDEAGARTEDFIAPVAAEVALPLASRLVDAEICRSSPPGAGPRLQDHLEDQEQQLRIAQTWDEVFDLFDAVLCPAVPVAALPHDDRPRAQRSVLIDDVSYDHYALGAWSLLTSLPRLPSVTFPAGLGEQTGLPIGLQLVGRYRADHDLLRLAATVDEVVDGWRAPPGW
jgi:amidase